MNQFAYFDALWNDKDSDLEEQKKHWDIRAQEFNQYRSQTAEERMSNLIDFLEKHGVNLKDSDVLDIGCGSGQLSIALAKRSKSLTGVDISPEMIRYAKENAELNGSTNTIFQALPWEDIDLSQWGWEKKYDFVIANMTPAINSRQSLEKMIRAGREYFFMSGYLDRFEPVKAEIEENVLHWKPRKHDHGRAIYCTFNILWLKGIYPQIAYYEMERVNDRTIEEAFIYYTANLETKKMLSLKQKEEIRSYLHDIAQDGRVQDTFKSKTAWLLWNVSH